MSVQGTLTPFDSGKSQDRVVNLLDLLMLWGYCDMGFWFDIGEDLGERRRKTEYLLFPAHFPSSTGRKLLSLNVQSAVEMDMAKHCLPYLVRVLVKDSTGIGS